MEPHEVIIPIFALFAIFIALPWMILSFLSRKRGNAIQAAGDPALNSQLMALADKLQQRLDAVETILDHEIPGWRTDAGRGKE